MPFSKTDLPMIREDKRKECVRLYREGGHTIQEIMSLTGIRSSKTVYSILSEAGVDLRPRTAYQRTVVFDEETAAVIERVKPRNLSAWICKLIRQSYSD